jgi:hypothetical protein
MIIKKNCYKLFAKFFCQNFVKKTLRISTKNSKNFDKKPQIFNKKLSEF